jgi:hypothetical protein
VRLLTWLLPVFVVITGCASSSNNASQTELPSNLITLQSPGDTPSQPSKVYIDSVKQITHEQQSALLINGTFPDACTKLESVTHEIKNDSLMLHFKAWRNPDTLCAQVLTPFSFLYDKLSEKELSQHSQVIINGTAYSY